MTVRLSTGARNGLAQGLGFGGLFNRGTIDIYSGAQPSSADGAITGTLLGRVTANSAAKTSEVRAAGTVTVTGGSGSITAVTVGTFNIIGDDAAIPFTTSTAVTAGLLADAINRNGVYEASVVGSVVTINPRAGVGAAHNTYVVSSTGTCTCTYANMSGGVSPVNGLIFAPPVAGVIAKSTGQVWSFAGIAAGTAGWFRLIGSQADGGLLVSSAPYYPRMDGAIAVSGSDLNLSNIAILIGSPNTIDAFSFTIPAQ